MIRPRTVIFALCAVLSLGATACRSGSPFDVSPEQGNAIGLVVKNDNYADMDVYAVSDGLPTRVGTVTGLSSKSFYFSDSFTKGTDFRVVATPIGGNGRASTGPIQAGAGQTIYFTINTVLRTSTVSIR
ncbi:MAG: hypothetical protein ABJE47_24645 [bacterium]